MWFETPIFHPNIISVERAAEKRNQVILEQAHMTEDEFKRRHADIYKRLLGYPICIDGLKRPEEGGNFRPELSLYDICVEVVRMITYQNYRLFNERGAPDVFNGEAMLWTNEAEKGGGLLPIDKRQLLDQRTFSEREIYINIEVE
ncbi:MAG: hypothetical protein IPK17_17525 [Chloroflexi bacterium]|uniref:hypothetical protein n=1 Tax=Candidatus Flexifilum breve TaxID=3140694 RepID=UPI003134F70F|nr:hypothetical protein [Chloroflexota bacterium]